MRLEIGCSLHEQIKLSSIIEPKYKVRRDAGNLTELATSISEQGLLEPILVRPSNGKFEIVAGSRRVAACRLLGWRQINCQVLEANDKEAFEIALTENVDRKTLNPLEEALAFEEYVRRFGWGSETELAKRLGKSPQYVSRRLKLLSFPRETLEDFFRRRQNPSLIEEILSIENEEFREELLAKSCIFGMTTREVRRLKKVVRMEDSERDWLPQQDKREQQRCLKIRRAMLKTSVALQVAMQRLDEVINSLEEEDWVLRDILLQQRQVLHNQIDLVFRLKKKVESNPLLAAPI
jgi:ParB family chromosome partitioning protein